MMKRQPLVSVHRRVERLADQSPVAAGWAAPTSLRLAALLWVVGVAVLVAGAASPLVAIAGLVFATAGTAVVGFSAQQAERRWRR